MIRKILCSVLVFAVLALALSGCSLWTKDSQPADDQTSTQDNTTGNNDENLQSSAIKLNLYFPTNDNEAVIKEIRELSVKDGEVANAAVMALLEGPKDSSLRNAFPEGTKLLSIKIEGNTATVDFSKQFNQVGGSVAEIVERVSLVNTLTDIKGIEKVKILIEGKDLIGPSGFPLGELKKTELDAQGKPVPGETRTFTLYFGSPDADAVKAEKRDVVYPKGEDLVKVIFDELAKGPGTQGLIPSIPEGTRLMSVDKKDGVCSINLSKEFIDNQTGGSAGEAITIYSIVNSLTELPGIDKVQFLIEGQVREYYTHAEFSEPFPRNESFIQK